MDPTARLRQSCAPVGRMNVFCGVDSTTSARCSVPLPWNERRLYSWGARSTARLFKKARCIRPNTIADSAMPMQSDSGQAADALAAAQMSRAEALAVLHGSYPVFAPGEVWLVGAGPGDPGLLTLDAVAGLAQADVVVHDALVDPRVLALARTDAQLQF